MNELRIRPAGRHDCAGIARIYNHYLRETIVTFEEQEVPGDEMERRVDGVAAASLPWLVAEDAGAIAGYACADKWKRRIGYRFSVERTARHDRRHTGRGIGTRLYDALLGILRDRSVHSIIGGIALPNAASVALHERLGFVKAAHFREVGFKFRRWIDVGYWQTP